MSFNDLTNIDFMWSVWFASDDSKANCKKMAGVDGVTPQHMQNNTGSYIRQLQTKLLDRSYRHSKLKHYVISNARGEQDRIICTPTQTDKLLQRMLCQYLTKNLVTNQPLDRLGIGTGVSYGMGKDFQETAHTALSNIVRVRNTKTCGIKTDISNFYNCIERSAVMQVLSEQIDDQDILALLEQVVNAEIKGAELLLRSLFQRNSMTVGRGLRQGMPLSPILASALLKGFDNELRNYQWFNTYRVADDILCLCGTENEARRIHDIIEDKLNELSLTIPSLNDDREKTKIFSADDTIKFLGINIDNISDNINNYSYTQSIPNATKSRAIQKIKDIFSWRNEEYQNLNLSQRISRFESIKNGYSGYFSNCRDYNSFIWIMDALKNSYSKDLLRQKLPRAVISNLNSLTVEQKSFLGIPM